MKNKIGWIQPLIHFSQLWVMGAVSFGERDQFTWVFPPITKLSLIVTFVVTK
ncbi:MAG: hypothetical protein ABI358_13075 [Ginsengibacter sp.]